MTACRPSAAATELDPRIRQVLDKPIYQRGQFGLLEVDPASDTTIKAVAPDRWFVPARPPSCSPSRPAGTPSARTAPAPRRWSPPAT
jgi:hypothetical protein